jgi:8-oxo-dGTP pyrophosphatase MutT (NUDIX family)
MMKATTKNRSKPIVRYSAAGGIVVDGDQMLLLDRPSRGEVRLPKGHIEQGESPARAALRETAEESGYADLVIVADLGKQVVKFDFDGKQIHRREHYYLMRLRSHRQITRSEHDAAQFQVRWVPLAQASALLTFKNEQDMAARAIAELQGGASTVEN